MTGYNFNMTVYILLILVSIGFYLFHKKQEKDYESTTYYKNTRNVYQTVKKDLGLLGEYLIYKELASCEKAGSRFLFNCYIPMENGKTTEIDVLMIDKSGIYVFESKNYSGWIFGNEKQKMWTQTLKGKGRASHKIPFLNPILQNKLHIKWLKNELEDIGMNRVPVYSIIVFSERCTLKEITLETPNVCVVNRDEIQKVVAKMKTSAVDSSESRLTEEDICKIYGRLYPFTQVTEQMKKKHVQDIQEHLGEGKKNAKADENQKVVRSDSIMRPEPICPVCGSHLVMRTARRGVNTGKQFYGCSAYPKCRYSRRLS